MSSLKDKATFAYIKNVKRKMLCPACRKGEMLINRKTDTWECQKCDYKLSDKEFRSGVVFWFCDGCEAFLNTQQGFDINADSWVCTECGFKNKITPDHIIDNCKDCGAVIPDDSPHRLCENCRSIRREKMLKRMQAAATIAAGAATIIKATHDIRQKTSVSSDDSIDNHAPLRLDDEYPVCKSCGAKMTEFDGWAWYTCPDCGDSVRIIDGVTTWRDEIFGRSAHNSGKTCSNCGRSLSGGSYTLPWEEGNNPDGYIKCPHCGFINFEWEDDD
jgi:Zn finger protein HypA/HybF involved in hydrogenase expression